MKRSIRINFSDFDPGFDKTNNYFYHLLVSEYEVIIDEVDPEFHIYSCFGTDYLKYDCVRIFYTGENDIPDFNLCDYALSCHHIHFNDRHKRFPNFVTYNQHQDLIGGKKLLVKEDIRGRRFSNFIVSSVWADPSREEFFQLLSKYKHIDSPGKVFNNMQMPVTSGRWSIDKLNFMGNYKFSITFENSSLPGYTTEKILHAFVSNTIPIYWGNPLIAMDFNEDAFINCHRYNSFEEVVNRIIEIDNDDDLYLKIVNANVFPKNSVPEYLDEEYIRAFFREIFNRSHHKVARRSKYGFTGAYSTNYEKMVADASNYKTAVSGLKGYGGLLKKILKDRLS
jgi:alpha(1,3/1,4) fucosyltransferase